VSAVAYPYRIVGVALLLLASAAPTIAMAHSEGVEAADPNTPPAVLTFDGAARRYTSLQTARADWRSRFSNAPPPMADHAEHAGAGQHTPTQHH
jgi:hypothetical protein